MPSRALGAPQARQAAVPLAQQEEQTEDEEQLRELKAHGALQGP